jgi:hypothetical protein
MKTILNHVQVILERARYLLQDEPLRAISYGSAVVIYLVARASGRITDVSFEDAILQAGVAATVVISVVESARRYVSPAG